MIFNSSSGLAIEKKLEINTGTIEYQQQLYKVETLLDKLALLTKLQSSYKQRLRSWKPGKDNMLGETTLEKAGKHYSKECKWWAGN